jgi:hypothetical protein
MRSARAEFPEAWFDAREKRSTATTRSISVTGERNPATVDLQHDGEPIFQFA